MNVVKQPPHIFSVYSAKTKISCIRKPANNKQLCNVVKEHRQYTLDICTQCLTFSVGVGNCILKCKFSFVCDGKKKKTHRHENCAASVLNTLSNFVCVSVIACDDFWWYFWFNWDIPFWEAERVFSEFQDCSV